MARTVLLIDCCVHGEQSRTLKLAQRYLDTLEDVQVNHQKLYELDLAPLSYVRRWNGNALTSPKPSHRRMRSWWRPPTGI